MLRKIKFGELFVIQNLTLALGWLNYVFWPPCVTEVDAPVLAVAVISHYFYSICFSACYVSHSGYQNIQIIWGMNAWLLYFIYSTLLSNTPIEKHQFHQTLWNLSQHTCSIFVIYLSEKSICFSSKIIEKLPSSFCWTSIHSSPTDTGSAGNSSPWNGSTAFLADWRPCCCRFRTLM